MGKNIISKQNLLDFVCTPLLQFLKANACMLFAILLIQGIFDNKRLLNSSKIDRNPRFEYSKINSLEIFLNPFFYSCQQMVINSEFSRGSFKVFSTFQGIFLHIRLLRFFWWLNLHLKVSRFYSANISSLMLC